MKPKTLILMVVAVGCGLVAAFLVKQGMTKETPKESYLVGKMDPVMPIGTRITDVEGQFQPRDYLPGTAPAGAIKNDEESRKALKDKLLSRVLLKDEALTQAHVTDETITAKLKPNQRAMGMAANLTTGVGGFIGPDVNVDMVVSYQKGADPVVQTFLSNIRILAVDSQMVKPADQTAGVARPTIANVTVAVDPEEAQKIILAQRLGGTISLTLRRNGDTDDTTTEPTTNLDTPKGKGKKETKVKVLVATGKLPQGSRIDDPQSSFKVVEVPKSEVDAARVYQSFDDSLLSKDENALKEGVLLVALEPGDKLWKNMIGKVVKSGDKVVLSEQQHVMTIYNGSKEPIVATFKMPGGTKSWNGERVTGISGNMTSPVPVVPAAPATSGTGTSGTGTSGTGTSDSTTAKPSGAAAAP